MTYGLDSVRPNNEVCLKSFAILKIQQGSFRMNFNVEQSLAKVQNLFREIFCKSIQ